MSSRAAQLLRAIASIPARPRTVLKAGHSKVALSVYSAPYARGSRVRYASTRRALSESMPALASLVDRRGDCEQAALATKPVIATALMNVFTGRYRFFGAPASAGAAV